MFLFVLFLVVTGCAASVSTPLVPGSISDCETGDLVRDKACYRERFSAERQQHAAPKPAGTDAPASSPPAPTPVGLPVEGRVVLLPRTAKGGCDDGFNFSVANRTNVYIEVQSRALLPCGESYLVVEHVQQKNGGVRPAYLIPPGGVGAFYFDRLKGGVGPQDWTVIAYEPSSLSGSAAVPRIAVGKRYVHRDHLPFDNKWGNTQIFSSDVGLNDS
ncbi:hypothetical protein HY479_03190 [Candidatus Uhrbacteria bacterium]|nr:hypothetical protein [Candidatus Uhrbacteria bacterium]